MGGQARVSGKVVERVAVFQSVKPPSCRSFPATGERAAAEPERALQRGVLVQ